MKYLLSAAYVTGFAGIFLFYMGFRVTQYNLFLLVSGAILFLLGSIIATIILLKKEKDKNNAHTLWKAGLIAHGMKIEVDLTKAEIKTNHYINKTEQPLSKYGGLDELAGKDTNIYEEMNTSIIVFKTEVHGKEYEFNSPVIYKDAATLSFLMDRQPKTFIYVHKSDESDYYFDLDFLE